MCRRGGVTSAAPLAQSELCRGNGFGMTLSAFLFVLLLLSGVAYQLGRRRAVAVTGGRISNLHSLPVYHGLCVALGCALPSAVVVVLWSLAAGFVGSEHREALDRACLGLASAAALGGLYCAQRAVSPTLRARNIIESALRTVMLAASSIAVLTTIGIVLSLIFEAARFFEKVSVPSFLFGLEWSPQMAIRADQVAASGSFGAVPLLVGTLLITSVAMSVAVPVGLFSAIYMSEYATRHARAVLKPMLEILAGIPTVVYGFFAALTVAPVIRAFGERLGIDVASESALAAGLVMGVMIIPFVSSLSDDVMHAVPQSLRDGAYALGATRAETIRQVVLPAALPGVVAAILLAISRAVGETMIVVMAAGLAANLTLNPLQAVTTVTVQIVTLLVGDQEFDSAKTLSAFALGLVLFALTLGLNLVALRVVRRYREKYD